jgi:hypothetical protein
VLDMTFEREPGRTAEDFLEQDTAQRRPRLPP